MLIIVLVVAFIACMVVFVTGLSTFYAGLFVCLLSLVLIWGTFALLLGLDDPAHQRITWHRILHGTPPPDTPEPRHALR